MCVWLQKLRYDLGECADWEFMFLSNDRSKPPPPKSTADDPENGDDDDNAYYDVGFFVKLFS